MTAIKQVKAFIVETDDPDETVIAFATSNVAARRQGADEIGTDFGSVSCRRLPWADEYAGKGIPAEAYIQHGWRVSCTNCGYMVSQDSYTMDESGEEIPHNPVYCGEHVYCCPDCKSAHEAVSKEQAVLLWYEGFRSEPIPVLEAWEAIGHDIGCNPSKQELLDSLRNMAAICEAHGNDMPKPAQHARDSAELRRLCSERDEQWRIRRDVEADRDTANAISAELRAERDALAAELAAIKGQQPVAFYWQDIGYPEPHKHGPYFGWPSESALRNVDGVAIPVPLYTLPPTSHDQEGA